jgi:excisionase family DNA binding protein
MKSNKFCKAYLLHSRRDAAAILGISLRSIDYLIANRELTTRVIGRRRLIPDQALKQYARRDHPGRIVPPGRRRGKGGAS